MALRLKAWAEPAHAGETVVLRALVEDEDDGMPRSPTPTSITAEVLDADGAVLLAAGAMTLEAEARGQATAATAAAVTDAGSAWTPDEWRQAVLRLTAGTGAGQERRIASNTATVLNVDVGHVTDGIPDGPFAVPPDASTLYEIHRGRYRRTWESSAGHAGEEVHLVVRAARAGSYNAAIAEATLFLEEL